MITVRGDGFGATDTINLDFGSTIKIVTPMSDRYGTFTTSFTINLQPYGTTTISAYDEETAQVIRVYDRLRIDTHITLVTPLSGTVGSAVSVIGNGFGGLEPIRIEFGTTQSITAVMSTGDGYFEAGFTVDSQSIGTNTITAYGANTGQSYATYTFRVMPKLTSIVPTEGTVGTTITLSGDGFRKSETVKIDFGSTLTMTVDASNDGSFVREFVVNEQAYGTCSVVATGLSSNGRASIDFKILQAITHLTPTTGTVGAFITISGQGYGRFEHIRLEFGTTKTLSQKLTSEGGTFTHTFAIDTQVYGTTTLTAWDDTHNICIKRTLFILPEIILVTPNKGTVGSIVTVAGNGYRRDEVIRVEFGSNMDRTLSPLPTIVTEYGSWTTTWTVDTQSFGTTTVLATDELAAASKLYTILPEIISITPSKGTVGSMVTVSGNGYGSSAQIRLEFGSVTTMIFTTAEVHGSFTASFTVDTQYYGTATVGAHDDYNQLSIRKKYTILPNIILITPKAGTVGSQVTVSGNGFGMARSIRIAFGNTPTRVAQVWAEHCGSFTTSFTIDTQSYGTTTITGHDDMSGISASGTNTILPEIILVSPDRGTVGTIVTVRGNGYGSSQQVRLKFGNTQTIAMILAQSNGSFTTTFTVDTQGYGTTTITAHDDFYQVRSAKTVVILPNIFSVSPTCGSVGTLVTIKGNGYGATENILVDFGTTPDVKQVYTDGTGLFTTVFTVNLQPYGTCTIIAAGTATGVSAWKQFNISSVITGMTPTNGSVTTVVSISGNGFGSSEPIRIGFGKNATITSTTCDINGSFTTSFVIDTQIYGTKTVTVSGLNSGRTDLRQFRIEASIAYVSPSYGSVGTVVTILGTGYGFEEFIYAHFGTKQQIASLLKASQNGSFTIRFTIDTQQAGTTTVTAEGMNKAYQKAYNTFVIKPEVWRVSPTEGVVGTIVTVWGTGYVASETVRLDFGTKLESSTATAVTDGSFVAYFVVDTQPVGTTTVRVTSTTLDWTHYNYFKITTGIFVTPQSGSVGTIINVWGAGYQANEQVKIGFGTNSSITTTQALDIGNINTTFTIDAQAYGPRPVAATGVSSGVAATTTCSIFQHITHVLPDTGPVGTDVEIRGDGYERTDTISIEFGTTPQIVSGPASYDGTFSLKFVIDTQVYGTTTITATGVNGVKEVDD
ncbi:MAG: hypothetical protein AAB296_06605, partial [Candidatus Desantisbacteria bacterium]